MQMVERPSCSNCSVVADIKVAEEGSLELRPGHILLALFDPCKSPSSKLRKQKAPAIHDLPWEEDDDDNYSAGVTRQQA